MKLTFNEVDPNNKSIITGLELLPENSLTQMNKDSLSKE